MLEFADIVGQDETIGRLQRAMASSRMPHAFLFAGPAGVGRRTTATALARTLLCESPLEAASRPEPPLLMQPGRRTTDAPGVFRQACGRCDDCRMMAAGTHPDFHLVYKELAAYHEDSEVRKRVMQELGIEVVRSFLIAPAGQTAGRRRGKVFVVLEADLLNVVSQNALLKTLEEPPPGVTIILICERPEHLLPTTRSRCAMMRFGPLPREFVAGRLVEGGLDRSEAEFWADFTDGSLGLAARGAREGLYEIKRQMVDRVAALGDAGDVEFAEYLRTTMESQASAAVKASKKGGGSELSKNLAIRRATGMMLRLLGGAFRDAIRVRCGCLGGRRLTNADQPRAIEALAEKFTSTQLAEIIEQISEYERLLWRNVNPKVVWDNVMIACASAAPLRA